MKSGSAVFFAVAALAGHMIGGQPVYAQSQESTEKEIEQLKAQLNVLREEQLRMRRDLDQIKTLLKRQARTSQRDPYRGKTVNTDAASFKGKEDAKVTLVEFSDFQCAYCARYVRETLPRLEEEYINSGRVKLVFQNLPLEQIHKSAFRAAEAADCAGQQGQFWPMHDLLFANSADLSEEAFARFARRLNLSQEAFATCMVERKSRAEVESDVNEARQLAINGTPTFLIGLTQPGKSQITVLRSLRGAVSYEQMKQALDSVLERE
ncbi:MAG: DsbA family protein [Acidobacteriota bacterium]